MSGAHLSNGAFARNLLHASIDELEERKRDDSIASGTSTLSGLRNYAPSSAPVVSPSEIGLFNRVNFVESLVAYAKAGGTHAPIRYKVREMMLKVLASHSFSDADISIIARHLYDTMLPSGMFGRSGSEMGKILNRIMLSTHPAKPSMVTTVAGPEARGARDLAHPVRERLRHIARVLKREHKKALTGDAPYFWKYERELYKHLFESSLGDRELINFLKIIHEVNAGILGVPLETLHHDFKDLSANRFISAHTLNYPLDLYGLPLVRGEDDWRTFTTLEYTATGELVLPADGEVKMAGYSCLTVHPDLMPAGMQVTEAINVTKRLLSSSYFHFHSESNQKHDHVNAMRRVQSQFHQFIVQSIEIQRLIEARAADDIARLEDAVQDEHDAKDIRIAELEEALAAAKELTTDTRQVGLAWYALCRVRSTLCHQLWTAETYVEFTSIIQKRHIPEKLPSAVEGATISDALGCYTESLIFSTSMLAKYAASVPLYLKNAFYDNVSGDEFDYFARHQPVMSRFVAQLQERFKDVYRKGELLSEFIAGLQSAPAQSEEPGEAAIRMAFFTILTLFDPAEHMENSLYLSGDARKSTAAFSEEKAALFQAAVLQPLIDTLKEGDEPEDLGKAHRLAVWCVLTALGQLMVMVNQHNLLELHYPSAFKNIQGQLDCIDRIRRIVVAICDTHEHVLTLSTVSDDQTSTTGDDATSTASDDTPSVEYCFAAILASTCSVDLSKPAGDTSEDNREVLNLMLTETISRGWSAFTDGVGPDGCKVGKWIRSGVVPEGLSRHYPELFCLSHLIYTAAGDYIHFIQAFDFAFDPVKALRCLPYLEPSAATTPLSILSVHLDLNKVMSVALTEPSERVRMPDLIKQGQAERRALLLYDADDSDSDAEPDDLPAAGAGAGN